MFTVKKNRNRKVKFIHQHDRFDCGLTCIEIICDYYSVNISRDTIDIDNKVNQNFTSILHIRKYLISIGFNSDAKSLTVEDLNHINLPCILHWRQNHYVVLYRIKKGIYYLVDPSAGYLRIQYNDFIQQWIGNKYQKFGIALVIEKTEDLLITTRQVKKKFGYAFFLSQFYNHQKLLFQVLLGLGISSGISLILPYATQAIVDLGIGNHDTNFVVIILGAQAMLLIGNGSISLLRSWTMLFISNNVNIIMQSRYISKLLRLSIRFYEKKTTGDILQRINDQQKVEMFFTTTLSNSLFSILNLFAFSIVLIKYNVLIFLITITSFFIQYFFVRIFYSTRKIINYSQFNNASKGQSKIIDIINGIQDIKLTNSELKHKHEWESLQSKTYELKYKSLQISQYQQIGTILLSQFRNLTLTFLSIQAVMHGSLTIGGMVAIQYVIGQVSNPIEQLIGLAQSYQDTKLSSERFEEIHNQTEEAIGTQPLNNFINKISPIHLNKLSFKYPSSTSSYSLDDITMSIPAGKVTALVGKSGSGKTTLLKLLLKIYDYAAGDIYIGDQSLKEINTKQWRNKCGTVFQDSHIFSDTIANNISLNEHPNQKKIEAAVKIANLTEVINSLFNGINTIISSTGSGLSNGQKQRILIARAVYNDPDFLFLDEATNSLDSETEKVILKNLGTSFKGKTVIVATHKLTTIAGADNIIFLDKGRLVEQGTHDELIALNGYYSKLYTII